MQRQYARVYYWRDWPGNDGRTDSGIDLVAIRHDDMPADGSEPTAETPAVAVQCKFYAHGTVISKPHLDSFLAESGKHPFVHRIFVDTTGVAWNSKAQEAITGQQIPVSRIGLEELRASGIDWTTFHTANPEQAPEQLPRKQLREHQRKAISAVLTGLCKRDRGVLVMACGTGKTFTSLKLAETPLGGGLGEALPEETLTDLGVGDGNSLRLLFLVPSLALMSQTLQEWAAECEVPFQAWSVCSDTKVNRKRAANDDLADITATDLMLPPTTDAAKLAASLARHKTDDGLQVVFSTYQSIDIVHQAQELAGDAWRDFDLIICDEAHRTTGVTLAGEDESAFTRVHGDDYIRATKRLYMTATPRIYQPAVKNLAKEKEAVLASMDDESIYGPELHRLGFGEAVSAGLLTDYKVVVLAVPEEQMTVQLQQSAGAELPLPEVAKLVGCWNALAKRQGGWKAPADGESQYGEDTQPMRRAVAFAKDIRTSKRVAAEFPKLVADELLNLENDDPSDNLEVQCQHVDGGMNAVERGTALHWLKDEPGEQHPVCRILTNARCLSEGVDVPTLDAVLFLNPRKSQVDVIQAVGRVMRRAEGKEFGYIILPVAVPAGVSPEEALNDNERFRVVWQVLQAIRAHDDRFDNTINKIEYNEQQPENILVDVVSFSRGGGGQEDLFAGSAAAVDEDRPVLPDSLPGAAPAFTGRPLDVQAWKDAVFAKLVKKVGNRLYWDDWSRDIGEIAGRYMELIRHLLGEPGNEDAFGEFVEALRLTLNPEVSSAQAVEMLAQHLITKPLFDAMFPDQTFTAQNPVSRAMEGIVQRLSANGAFEREREPLAKFYETMTEKIRGIDNLAGKQDLMRTLYDRFFTRAFAKMQDRLGIVFTPVEVVDYILRSADVALQAGWKKSLSDRGVAIIEPFLGTGTFVARLLQSGLIRPEDLEHKYRNEIFANEIVLLSYYIASVNIEQVYHEIRREQGHDEPYQEFRGITLTDTFNLQEQAGQLSGVGDFQANLERVQRQRQAEIRVVVMNPPYSAGQASANDDNQNLKYPQLDARIAETYVAKSSAGLKNSLYDSYLRALRWASDRIGEEGVIAFVSNNSFIDGAAAGGVRLSWQQEFSDVFIFDLRGNARTQGETRRRESGNVFGEGSRTGVAITVLVKRRDHEGSARVHYADIGDYLSREEKLERIARDASIAGTDFGGPLTPNAQGDWINQRDENYVRYQLIGDKATKGKSSTPGVFLTFSNGLKTNRDAWCWNFAHAAVTDNMRRMIANYNHEVISGSTSKDVNLDASQISWTHELFRDLDKKLTHEFDDSRIVTGLYRPYCRSSVYFSRDMNNRVFQMPRLFPTPQHPNLAIGANGAANKDWSCLATTTLPDLEMVSKAQWFSLFTWQKHEAAGDGQLDLFGALEESIHQQEAESGPLDFSRPISEQIPTHLDGYERQDNITDATLHAYRTHYSDSGISKEDIFFYVYALLHHPEYRERYAADLKKGLPRIPKCEGFWEYAEAGRELAELHVNYEQVEPHPQLTEQWEANAPSDPWQRYRVTKPGWTKRTEHTGIRYNEWLTIAGIPEAAQDYQVGGRSPLEWVLDRYQVSRHKESGIVNNPNDYCREIGEPDYIVQLIKRLVTVSVESQRLIGLLPDFEITESTVSTE